MKHIKSTLLLLCMMPSLAVAKKKKHFFEPGIISGATTALAALHGALKYNENHGDGTSKPYSSSKAGGYTVLMALSGFATGLAIEWYRDYVKNDIRLKDSNITKYFTAVGGIAPLLYEMKQRLWDDSHVSSLYELVYKTEGALALSAFIGYVFDISWNSYELSYRPLIKMDREYSPLKGSKILNALYKLWIPKAEEWSDHNWTSFFGSEEGEDWIAETCKRLKISKETFYQEIEDAKDELHSFVELLDALKKRHPSLYSENHAIQSMKKWVDAVNYQINHLLPVIDDLD